MTKLIFISILFLTFSCSLPIFDQNYYKDRTFINAPEDIRLKAFYAAEFYLDSNMEYELGGDDTIYIPPYSSNSRGIDCSGLVINSYSFAVEDTDYSLGFTDASANSIYSDYSEEVLEPEKGDLIIWTDDNNYAYHIALLEKVESGFYYFIESNLIESINVNGVNYRQLSVNTTYNITIKRLKVVIYQ